MRFIEALCSVLAFAAGLGAQAAPPAAPQAPQAPPAAAAQVAPPRFYAPYIMIGRNSDLAQIAGASGIEYFTLAFVLDGGGCQAAWGGRTPLAEETALAPAIAALRQRGGDAIVSFGGAGGRELGVGCTDAGALQAQYQAVIDKYGITMFDLDIEGRSLNNKESVDRRNTALAALKTANPRLQISYTLPVETNGLSQGGLDLLKNAAAHNLGVDLVSIMTMDYGGAADPKQMGPHAISATGGTIAQLRALGMQPQIGLIPMIGLNDNKPEAFTLSDAKLIADWAQTNPAIVRMSMWSVGRDQPCPNGAAVVGNACSGIPQEPYAYSKILGTFH
jgi:chitinase